MGFLSSPKASSSSQTLVSIGTTTLGGVQLSLTLLEKAMDGTNIPFVKGVAGAALEVIKIARAIQTNREECDDLMKKSTSLLIVILGSFSGKTTDAIPDHLKKGVERLATSFQEVLTELRVIEKGVGKRSVSGLAKAVLYYVDNEEKLKSCSAKLEWAMAEFQVTSNVDSCLKDLERHQELKKAVHNSTHKLLESQATIQRGQAGIQDSLSELRDAMSDKKRINTSELLSTDMPPDPRIFGRHEYIEMAVILLLSNTGARVAILGPGGMGKTSVALKIMHDARVVVRFGENRYWVPCEQAKSFTLFIELLARSLHLPGSTSNDRLAEIIAFLKNSEHLHVFLLDNFETPWDIEGKQSDVADVLTRLASIPSVSFIVTMRGYQYPSSNTIDWSSPRLPSLSQLDLDAAQEAFLRISPDSAGDPELKTLLQKLDCMPLAITLMAKLAEAGETVSDLLEQWKSERTKLLDQPGGDRRNSIEVSIKLSLDSRVIKGVPDSIRLLSVLALLPAGAGLARLPDMCPSIPGWKAALRALRGAALVYDSADKSRILMLSPIQSYVILHHPPEHSALEELRSSYFKLVPLEKTDLSHDESNSTAKEELGKEETNMEAILIDALRDPNTNRKEAIKVSRSYTLYLFNKQPRTEVIIEAIKVARATKSSQLAICLSLHGVILRRLDLDEEALPIFKEAKDLEAKLGMGEAALVYQRVLGSTLLKKGEYDKARAVLQEVRDTMLSLDKTQDAARFLWESGHCFYVQREYGSALSSYEQARSEFISIDDLRDSIDCLTSIGAALGRQGRYDAAKAALEEARVAYLDLGVPYEYGVCLVYLGDTLEQAGDYSLALEKYEEALGAFKQMGHAGRVATCMGDIERVRQILDSQ